MKRSLLKQVTLYHYRYFIGAAILIASLTTMMVGRLDLAPAGLSNAAINSVVTSSNLSLDNALQSSLVDLPYHLLQQLSINLFGLHGWSMVLPSTIVAILTGIVFTLMIRRWFRSNIAIVTGLMLVTSVPFLTLGRSAVPTIMLLFWLSLILLAATKVLHDSKRSQLWLFIGIIGVSLSLYTPLMVYPLAALSIAGLLHPHVRYVARRINPYNQAIGAFLFLAIATPLLVSILTGSTNIRELIGITGDMPNLDTIIANAVYSIKTSLGFHVSIIGDLPKPFFIAPVAILAALGLVKTIVDNHAARSYMLILWFILLIAPLLLSPMNLYATVIPVFLLVAIGIEVVIHEWYKLFPLNPYARIGGLIPLSVLLILIMATGPFQYLYGHQYGESNTKYHQAFEPTRTILDSRDQSTTLVTSHQLQPFYEILTREYPKLEVTNSLPGENNLAGQVIIHDEADASQPDLVISQIITSSQADGRELLRVYKME